MKLRQLRLDGFGALRGEYTFDAGRLTLLLDDNERGKTTLLSGLAAALYGLENDRRSHRMLTPLERWRPWGGGTFRVELELDAGGRRLWIKRDFERGTVEVWDEAGREVSDQFREGRDEYPVGRLLLGLDADEFEKCALVRQGDLDRVVPADARERGATSIRARLEAAADSHVGDTSASEAVRVLEDALRRYTCPEVESSGLVDTAIARLELKRETLEAEIHTLEHDLDANREPLDELARLDDEERATREAMASADRARDASLAQQVRRQLEDDAARRAEVARLEAEAAAVAPSALLPANAEAQFREALGRMDEIRKNLDTLEQRRREEVARRREGLDRELAELAAFAIGTAEDADRCVSLAAELRRLVEEDRRLRDDVFMVRESLATRGHEPERYRWLQERFGPLGPEKQGLLRRQHELQLAYQTEVATLERERTESSELLRAIDGARMRWRMPGGFLVALGIASAVAGVAVMFLRGLPVLWTSLFAAGGVLLAAGIATLTAAGRRREPERADALKRLSEAQRRLGALKQARAETEVSLQILARQLGYRDQVDLLQSWSEYMRISEESAPVLRAQQDLATVEQRRARAGEEAAALLARFGGGAPEPAALDAVAQKIRRVQALQQAARDLERAGSRLNDEARVIEAEAIGYRERAVRLLQSAGLVYDPERSWDDHARELGGRVQSRLRHATLTEELLPRARHQLLDASSVGALRAQLAAIETRLAGGDPGGDLSPIELEGESRRLRDELDRIQRRREDLRVRVEEVWRRFHAEHPEKVAQRERVGQALIRARRFQAAVELARDTVQRVAADTHRRWADHLNQRVGDVLAALGTGIGQVRFGDDLDFSVRMPNGQQLARGKADLQLSAGARDQLYLAVRLAMGEFLSRGQAPAPFLLDDVFATCDDARTHAGLRLLTELVARGHQVILLTCHRSRFQAIAALDPALFAERVQVVDVAATQPARP